MATPGGYQLFGRTPVPIWDPNKRFDAFEGDIVLFRPGDRIKFQPVTRADYDDAERKIEDGSYLYNIVEYQRFSVRNYQSWVNKLDKSERF